MSDTPRTDSVASLEGNWDTKALRMTAFARRLERELAEKTDRLDRLHESLDKNKRMFSDKLAEQVIASQTKRIKQLEDDLIVAKKAFQQSILGMTVVIDDTIPTNTVITRLPQS